MSFRIFSTDISRFLGGGGNFTLPQTVEEWFSTKGISSALSGCLEHLAMNDIQTRVEEHRIHSEEICYRKHVYVDINGTVNVNNT